VGIGRKERTSHGHVIRLNDVFVHCLVEVEGCVWMGSDARVLVWQANTAALSRKLAAGKTPITTIIHVAGNAPGTGTVWTGSWDGALRLWSVAEFKCVRTLRHSVVADVAQPIGAVCHVLDHVWSSSQDEIVAWSVAGERLGCTRLESVGGAVSHAAAMCFTGRHVWCAVGSTMLAYEARAVGAGASVAFRVDKLVIGHTARVLSLAHVPQQSHMWSGDANGTVMVWSTVDFDCLRTLSLAHSGAVYAMAFVSMRLNDQMTLEVWTAAKDCLVRVWDVESFHCVRELSSGSETSFTGIAEVGHAHVWAVGDVTISVWDQSRFGSGELRIVPYENGDKYVGELGQGVNAKPDDEPVRQGRGELHCSSGTRRAGYWHNDHLDGYCVDSNESERFYGEFRDGRRHGPGVVVYSDGSTFEGLWVRGVRKGNGVQRWPNGDELRGLWSDNQVTNAKFEKGSALAVPRCARELWRLEMRRVDKLLEDETNAPASRRVKRALTLPVSKWHDLDALNDAKLREMAAQVAQRFASRGHQKEGERLTADVLSIVLCDEKHALGRIVSDFVFLFKSTYHFSYGNVSQLLEMAVDDLRSFAAQLAAVCATVFPFVKQRQREELVMEIVLARVYTSLFEMYKAVNKKRDQLLTVKIDSLSGVNMKEIGVLPQFWLGWQPRHELSAAAATAVAVATPPRRPVPLSTDVANGVASPSSSVRFYSLPRPLEAVALERADDVADVAEENDSGASAAPVPSPVVELLPMPHLGARRRDEAAERLERMHAPYWGSVNELHEIRRYKTVARKLECLIKVSNSILTAVSEYVDKQRAERGKKHSDDDNDNDDDDEQMVLGTEDKFPILSYIVIRANLPTMYSELQLIRDFAHPVQLREEAGFRLVEIEQAVEYVNTLDWNLCDEKGILVPVKVLEQRMLHALNEAMAAFATATSRVPRVLWLAELLLLCGTNRGAKGFAVDSQEYPYVVSGGERNEYLKLGLSVLGVLGLDLRIEKDEVRVEFAKSALPLYIYSYLSTVMQRSVK
jgi:hypothetical protein